MCKRILILLGVTLALMGCQHGVRPMPDEATIPNLSIPQGQLQPGPATLPQPADGKRSTLLSNHVSVARLYHQLRLRHACLVRTLWGQQGITINGLPPAVAIDSETDEDCKAVK